ncbi:MAG TPA: hybrid sensor histidine kinase/response regulator [Fontimonas sp.]
MKRTVSVLAVDDVEQNLRLLGAALDRPDLRLLTARSGREALELLLREQVALALLDVRMPEMDGFELAELMRGSPRTRDIPIIFLTASEPSEHRTFRGYEAGAVDFLHKPLDLHELRSKVDVFVKLYRQQAVLGEQLVALQESLRLNEIFTAALGHDLRGPLNAISLNARLLERTATDAQAKEAGLRIGNSTRRMAQMIEQLLDMVRLRSGSMILDVGAMDIRELAESLLDEVRQVHHCRIELEVRGDTTGTWDRARVGQVLGNLLSNAAQHGEPSHPIGVVLDGTDPHCLQIRVSNAGAIRSELLPEIFEPFRSHGGSAERLGLGLYIVRELTQRHGGEVTVTSSADSGTVFKVTLPRDVAARCASG